MSGDPAPDHGCAIVALYDEALPDVYGYLLHRCRNRTVAEDLTAETFLAAVGSIRRGAVRRVTVATMANDESRPAETPLDETPSDERLSR